MVSRRDRPRTAGKSLTPPGGVGPVPESETPRVETGDVPTGTRASFEAMYSSGPLPLPAVLAGYKQVTPGLEQEIVQWAAANGEHRREMDRESFSLTRESIRKEFRTEWVGMGLGFVLAVGVLALAGYALSIGQDATAVALIVAELVALVTTFVYGTKHRRQEVDDDDSP